MKRPIWVRHRRHLCYLNFAAIYMWPRAQRIDEIHSCTYTDLPMYQSETTLAEEATRIYLLIMRQFMIQLGQSMKLTDLGDSF